MQEVQLTKPSSCSEFYKTYIQHGIHNEGHKQATLVKKVDKTGRAKSTLSYYSVFINSINCNYLYNFLCNNDKYNFAQLTLELLKEQARSSNI